MASWVYCWPGPDLQYYLLLPETYATNNAGTSCGIMELSFKTSAGNALPIHVMRSVNGHEQSPLPGKNMAGWEPQVPANVAVGPTNWLHLGSLSLCIWPNGTDINAALKPIASAPNLWRALHSCGCSRLRCPCQLACCHLLKNGHDPTCSLWENWNSAGGKLKETGNLHRNNPNAGATNEKLVSAFAGGLPPNRGAPFAANHQGSNRRLVGEFYWCEEMPQLWSPILTSGSVANMYDAKAFEILNVVVVKSLVDALPVEWIDQ